MPTLKEGDNAPEFSLTDNEGKLHSLKDYSCLLYTSDAADE